MLTVKTNDLETLKKELTSFFNRNFHQFSPFESQILAFCEALSQALFQQPKENADLIALAFWLRKSHLQELHQRFLKKFPSHQIRSPRGLIFHIPPSNQAVMLVYSWITSLLVGNGNIIRLSSVISPEAEKIQEIIGGILSQEQFRAIDETVCFVKYGHEESITAWISSHVDGRVIWGGDAAVTQIRKIPLAPHAKDIIFPDRYSFSAIDAENYLQTDSIEKERIAKSFFNDVYWFDQAACSSPRLIFWVGQPSMIEKAGHLFYQILQQVITKSQFEISLGGALLKQTFVYDQALTLPVQSIDQMSNELTVMYLDQADSACRLHCGQGLLYHIPIETLEEMVSFITQKDQTLTYYGFGLGELKNLIQQLNGKGLNRMVPIGQALDFDPIWDGQDLFTELTQSVDIERIVSCKL